MPRVIVTDSTFPGLERERAVATRHGATLEEARCTCEADVVAAAAAADVLLVQFAKVTRQAIERLPPDSAIVRYGIGLDNIDLSAARKRGIRVAYVPDYATGEVADHTATLILTALRKIIPLDQSVRAGAWDAVGIARPLRSLADATVGFVGFGRIGQQVHARLQPFGLTSIYYDPYADTDALSARAVDLDTLFSTADIVTLHSPLSPVTQHLVDAHRLAQMKSSAILVNTARGGLIDTAALEEALVAKRIAGAALDVFEQEPLPGTSGLRRCPNLILTPHAAWYSDGAVERLQALAADEVDRHLSGRPARCPAPIPEAVVS